MNQIFLNGRPCFVYCKEIDRNGVPYPNSIVITVSRLKELLNISGKFYFQDNYNAPRVSIGMDCNGMTIGVHNGIIITT